jgi:histone H3/H4
VQGDGESFGAWRTVAGPWGWQDCARWFGALCGDHVRSDRWSGSEEAAQVPSGDRVSESDPALPEVDTAVRVRPETFECLQVSVEEYLVHLFEETQLPALHGKRVTLKIKDINLVKRIRNERWRS